MLYEMMMMLARRHVTIALSQLALRTHVNSMEGDVDRRPSFMMAPRRKSCGFPVEKPPRAVDEGEMSWITL